MSELQNGILKQDGDLNCLNCSTVVRDISKYRGRFKRRHPSLCVEHQNKHHEKAVFNQQLAEGVRSVEDGK